MASDSKDGNRSPHARRRSFFSIIKRGLKWFGIAVLGLIALGCVYQVASTEIDKRNFPPPGEMVEVDGHLLHIHCMGEGSPAVILEAGGYSFSAEWYWVQQQIAPTHRVCAYDRAGNGWSEPGPAPRTALRLVAELHTLLQQAGIAGPYVLAGHSFGGILNSVYATRYPDEVSGVVLVDTAYASALHFDQASDYEQWKRDNDLLNAPLWALSRTGVVRLINAGSFRGYGYPPAATDQLVALRSTDQAFDTYYAEGIATTWENQASFASAHIGNRPLMVLWATVLPRQLTPDEQARLTALQQGVAALSSNSATRYVEGSDHGSIIGTEQYARQVTQAILDVIEAAQTGGRLAGAH
jgi:pimeloyl-ACP methyl ester carboxylesterase